LNIRETKFSHMTLLIYCLFWSSEFYYCFILKKSLKN